MDGWIELDHRVMAVEIPPILTLMHNMDQQFFGRGEKQYKVLKWLQKLIKRLRNVL